MYGGSAQVHGRRLVVRETVECTRKVLRDVGADSPPTTGCTPDEGEQRSALRSGLTRRRDAALAVQDKCRIEVYIRRAHLPSALPYQRVTRLANAQLIRRQPQTRHATGFVQPRETTPRADRRKRSYAAPWSVDQWIIVLR